MDKYSSFLAQGWDRSEIPLAQRFPAGLTTSCPQQWLLLRAPSIGFLLFLNSPVLYHCFQDHLTQSRPTLCDPVNCSLPGSSVHGVLQARIPEWVAVPFSRGSSQPRDQTQVSCIAGGFFTI